jgi:glycerophosphoryl diester phosphodiesterase
MRYAINNKVEGVEFDIQLTKDDEIIVFHDFTITRVLEKIEKETIVGNLYLRPDSLTLNELKENYYLKNSTEEKVSTLIEILDEIDKLNSNIILFIEIKSDSKLDILTKKLITIFEERKLYNRAILGSFNPVILYKIRKMNPKIVTLLFIKEWLFSPFFELGNNIFNIKMIIILQNLFHKCQKKKNL